MDASLQDPPPPPGDSRPELAREEVDALVDHLFVRTGMDFRCYARRAFERRLRHVMLHDGAGSVADLRDAVRSDVEAAALAGRLLVPVTAMFRDPPLWRALRERVVPELREERVVRVWVAGCSSGEEAYSMAILLEEEGIAERSRIYATDVDEGALARARAGTYGLEQMREYTRAHQLAGGAASLSDHYVAGASAATMKERLRRRLVFARHNLTSDGSFQVFQLVLCRNVIIYFCPAAQERIHALLHASLAPGGFLALGHRELVPLATAAGYQPWDESSKVWRRADLPAPAPAG
ncbi:MAG TPA: protein-glutamate O-methyltransferase CheR [Anaeromyxobacteraceae bacterium]|nr:protein-glutamate O-methyltransferase CheR [Anaeromyxobacteraceae bacterium]